jgi:restriction system protein
MPIPPFQTLLRPTLELLADKAVWRLRELEEKLAQRLGVTNEEREILLPSGAMPMFYNRVGWAKWHLDRAKLVETVNRGSYRITDRGLSVLAQAPAVIDKRFLDQFVEAPLAKGARGSSAGAADADIEGDAAPDVALSSEELMESASKALQATVATELVDRIKAESPAFFERLVVKLLLKMGYGGSRQEAGRAVGRSGDGGIDGIINEDRLGLDAVYIQAKRWEGTVGRPEIMKFVGALAGQRASKGVFISTSSYTQEAREYAAQSQYKVVLIDGERLAQLMIEYNLGVSVAAVYEVKRIDNDFFADE